jgi:hypothetical protein
MKLKKKWQATSKSSKIEKSDELINLIGWGINIDINIIRPFEYSQGPVEKIGRDFDFYIRKDLRFPLSRE